MAAGLAIAFANGVMAKLGEIALNEICASLQAANELTGRIGPVKKWLAEVTNICFDAEDIIDECSVQHLYRNTSPSCVCNCSQSIFRYKTGKGIKNLKDRINSTTEEAQRVKLFYNVSHLSQPSTSTSTRGGEELRRWSILAKDAPAVVIDHKVDEILTLLENPTVGVVAIMGIGGRGKTFLLQHVFNKTKRRYWCSAWISVSQTCSLRELQCDLGFHIDLDIDSKVSDVRAAELTHGKLEDKRCLVVLDDVWRSSVEGNLTSRLGFPTGHNNQYKIVVNTRSRDVAQNMNAHIYEMQHL
ncbi:hypothetical protein SUGI_0363220 [Cryptomeria japonica]|nr:hypothetical protein SUGI_0363220 [Cryptomeria japonica]